MAGISEKATAEMVDLIWHCCYNNNLSVVAVDDASGRVAGAFTGLDEVVMEEKINMWAMIKWSMRNPTAGVLESFVGELTLPVYEEHKMAMKTSKAPKKGYRADCM